MTFLFDHDVADEVVQMLRYWEHHVILLRNVLPVTATDSDIFAHACEQGVLMVTCNRDDFLNLIEKAGEAGLRGNTNFA